LDVVLSDEGGREPGSGFPVLDPQAFDALELAGVAGDEGEVAGEGLTGDEDIIGADGSATGLEVCTNFAGTPGVLFSEASTYRLTVSRSLKARRLFPL
jgi:hypothetical protein